MSIPILQYSPTGRTDSPSITNLPRKPLSAALKQQIINYLSNPAFITWRTYGEALTDLFTGETLNACGNASDDGTYWWVDDLPQYVLLYDVELPEEFIQHVQQQI